jgi:hypothetical protein
VIVLSPAPKPLIVNNQRLKLLIYTQTLPPPTQIKRLRIAHITNTNFFLNTRYIYLSFSAKDLLVYQQLKAATLILKPALINHRTV